MDQMYPAHRRGGDAGDAADRCPACGCLYSVSVAVKGSSDRPGMLRARVAAVLKDQYGLNEKRKNPVETGLESMAPSGFEPLTLRV